MICNNISNKWYKNSENINVFIEFYMWIKYRYKYIKK